MDNISGCGPVAAGLDHAELASRVLISAEGYASGRTLVAQSFDQWYARHEQAQAIGDQNVLSRSAGLGGVRRVIRSVRRSAALGAEALRARANTARTVEGHPALALNTRRANTIGRFAIAITTLAVILGIRFL